MIYTFARDVHEALRSRGYPVTVYYGPERVSREGAFSCSVVFARDTQRGDTIAPPMAARRNPGYRGVRNIGVVADIRAQSGRTGARVHEHHALADVLVDGVITAIADCQVAGMRTVPEFSEARFLDADEVNGAEVAAAAVYRLRWALPRAIERRDYDGSALPEGAYAHVGYVGRDRTMVALPGGEFEPWPYQTGFSPGFSSGFR